MTSDEELSPTEPELLGQRLKEAREVLGLSQASVANHLDIPRPSVSDIESGRRKVTFLELKALARLYRHPIAHFSGENSEPPANETTGALFRAASVLSPIDQQQVLRFAQFLRDAGPALPPDRASR